MTEFEKARQWRERLGFTRAELAEHVGYSVESIYWFERGINPPRGKNRKQSAIQPWVWLRYRLACAGFDRAKPFKW